LGLPVAKFSGSRILLTGATGLIGLNVFALLFELKRQSGLDFELITTSKSPLPGFLDEKSLSNKHKVIDLVCDVDFAKFGKFDFIIHSGGSAQPLDFMSKKYDTYAINSMVTKKLLNLLNPGGHFVFMSSTELYSGLQKDFFVESDIGTTGPSHPRSCYIEGKRAGEMFVHWKREDGFKASSVRLSYTYGPGTKSNDFRVINELIRSAITLGETRLRDSGLAVRSDLFSIDAAHMILQVLLSPHRPIYNIASSEISSIQEIAREISSIGNVLLRPNTFNEQIEVFGQDYAVIDTTSYFEDFPSFENCSLRDGLAITFNWQHKNLYS